MRALPNFKVFAPSDATQTAWIVQNAIADPAPMYIRLSREAFPDIYPAGESFESGKGKVVRGGRDAAVVACGLMVGNALAAAEILARDGIEISVIDMFCIKPIDRDLIKKSARETGAVVTAEEHTVIGGLGSAVAEVLCESGLQVPTGFVGLKDCHAECGPYAALQKKYGLDADAIAKKVKQVIKVRDG
jgi:transketolase